MVLKKTSIAIDDNTWKEARKRCIDLGISTSDYIERLIKKDITNKKV